MDWIQMSSMSENNQKRRHIFIRTSVKVLMVILVTVVGIFLYIRFDQTRRSFSIYHMMNSDIKTKNHDTFLLVTNETVIAVTTDASLNVTHAAQKRKELQMTEDNAAVTIVKERALSNHSTFEDMQVNSRSLNTDIVQETNFIIRPMISNSGTPPVNGNVMKENYSLINHKNVNDMIDSDKVYNKIGNTVNDRLYHTIQNESDQMIHYGYSTTDASTPVAGEDVSNSYYNVNDLSYNVDDYSYKEVKIPPKGNKWTTNGQSEPLHIAESSVGGSGGSSYGQNSYYDLKSPYPTGHTIYHRPSITKPKKLHQKLDGLDQPYEKTIPQYPISSKMNWKNIGILSLIKLGILKLKIIGLLQLMFLIGFKFKLFMIAIFFKFILMLKLMKFFKILILPVYIFSLFPILTSLFNRMVNMQASNGLNGSNSSGSSLINSLPGFMSNGGFSSSSASGSTLLPGSSSGFSSSTLLPGSSGGLSGSTLLPGSSSGLSGSTLLPGSSSGFSGGNLLPGSSSGFSGGNMLPGSSSGFSGGNLLPGSSGGSSGSTRLPGLRGGNLVPGSSRTLSNKLLSDLLAINIIQKAKHFAHILDESNVFNKHYFKTLDFFDPTLSILQKLLNSEKCVERLACRIMAAEKTGIIPLWVNRILHAVSMVIPNEKLQLYFKTYNDINHIYTNMSSASENWETWCLKRYECHTFNIINIVKDIKI